MWLHETGCRSNEGTNIVHSNQLSTSKENEHPNGQFTITMLFTHMHIYKGHEYAGSIADSFQMSCATRVRCNLFKVFPLWLKIGPLEILLVFGDVSPSSV